ncbi:MAG TPA: type II toxin-antitoxin system VapC family toxin [Thermoanaerobaculia bacterium]|nr:type II toxin-antitoxin system VapC family toxin [Thermoanaerobaculia bacterium]
MIVLDTNVISALMRDEPDPIVVAWLDGLPPESIWTTSITVFEVRLGLEILAAGKRRRQLEEAFAKALEEEFEGRVLPFDQSAAQAAGRIAAERRRVGRTIEIRDVQIAGIVSARKATLATRNTRHFEECGLVLDNPWSA